MFNFIMTALLVAVSVTIGKVMEAQSSFLSGSFLFFTIASLLIGNLIIIRLKFGQWRVDNDWIYFPVVLFMFFSLWLWVRVWDAAFVLVGGFALYLWLDHINERLRSSRDK